MEFWTTILAIWAATLGIFYFAFWNLNHFKKKGIPHVKPIPIFGNMGPNLFRIVPFARLIQTTYNSHPEAKYIGFHDFLNHVVMIRDPELIKTIAIKNFDDFPNHNGFVEEDQDPMFAKNLFSLKGERWREMRTLLSPTFTSSKMKMMFKLISQCSNEFVDFLSKQPTDRLNAMDAKDVFTRYCNDVIATAAFGVSVNSMKDRDNEFYMMGKAATNFEGFQSLKITFLRSFPKLSKFFNVSFIPRRVSRFFKEVIGTTIATRDAEGIFRPDMIQLMMRARDNVSVERDLTIEDIASQALVFFLGGFDTSATLMSFAAHEIAVNSDVHRKLQDEVDAVLRDCDGEVTYEALHGMQYLDAVLYETLRMYPPAPFLDRICAKSFQLPPALPGLKAFIIESGTEVWIPVYGIHHDPKYFPQPDKFYPERFDEENRAKMLAFGLGPRSCIGNRFALMETKLVLFHLLARFNFEPCSKTSIPMVLSKKSLPLNAKDGFWLNFSPREQHSLV